MSPKFLHAISAACYLKYPYSCCSSLYLLSNSCCFLFILILPFLFLTNVNNTVCFFKTFWHIPRDFVLMYLHNAQCLRVLSPLSFLEKYFLSKSFLGWRALFIITNIRPFVHLSDFPPLSIFKMGQSNLERVLLWCLFLWWHFCISEYYFFESVSWWFLTRCWVRRSLYKSTGLLSIFWPILVIL